MGASQTLYNQRISFSDWVKVINPINQGEWNNASSVTKTSVDGTKYHIRHLLPIAKRSCGFSQKTLRL